MANHAIGEKYWHDKAMGLEEDLRQLVHVCKTRDLETIRDYVKMNYPKGKVDG